jgi:hypothetical protein
MIEQKYQKLNVLIRIFLNPEPRVGEHHVIVVVAHRLVQRCFRKCADDNERIRMDGGRGWERERGGVIAFMLTSPRSEVGISRPVYFTRIDYNFAKS